MAYVGVGRTDAPGGVFVDVSAGERTSCGVRAGGALECWGDGFGEDVPVGSFTRVSVSHDPYDRYGCALGEDGSVVCWGRVLGGYAGDPDGVFVDVAAGVGTGCGLRGGGEVVCWGVGGSATWGMWTVDPFAGRAGADAGGLISLFGGFSHWCGLDAAGVLVCWGGPVSRGVSDPPVGKFVEVSGAAGGGWGGWGGGGADYVCGLRAGGEIDCWAAEFGSHDAGRWVYQESGPYEGHEVLERVEVSSDYGQAEPPAGRFVSVSAAPEHACAVDTSGRVVCWGSDYRHQLDPAVPGRGWSVNNHYCRYRPGYDYGPPPGPVDCRVGRGVSDDGSWVSEEITRGDPSWGSWEFWGVYDEAADPLRGPFVEVSAGGRGGCGLRADAALVCWGVGIYGAGSDALDGAFTAVAVGDLHACALRERPDDTDSNVVCWGIANLPLPQSHACRRSADGEGYWNCSGPDPDYGYPLWRNQTEAPAGSYTQISAGANHTCAITQDQAAVCWGDNRAGQSDAPEGEFTQVSAVDDSSCALSVDGTPVCWGANAGLRPPPGEFTSVSAAGRWGRPCGIRPDGAVQCWGQEGRYGEPPEWVGPLVDASVGQHGSCGVRADASLACWDNRTKADPHLAAGTQPPEGEFMAVPVAHYGGYCALRAHGSIDCRIRDGQRDYEPPSGEFTRIARGVRHACAIRTDGTVACWGSPADEDDTSVMPSPYG
ncbi:MAG: RCC1 domain-containing protein [Acidimicrobiaceae bacterium]|nr:RCC1 domain-containing protein [Acidimicrobiaceae bacterium]